MITPGQIGIPTSCRNECMNASIHERHAHIIYSYMGVHMIYIAILQ